MRKLCPVSSTDQTPSRTRTRHRDRRKRSPRAVEPVGRTGPAAHGRVSSARCRSRERLPVRRHPPQLLMPPHRPHPPAVQPGHRVGPGRRGRPVGDQDTGGRRAAAREGLGDAGLGHRVEAGQRVVEDQQAAAVGERPGESEPLGLAAGARGVGQRGGVAVGQAAYEVVRVGGSGSRPDVGGGGGPADRGRWCPRRCRPAGRVVRRRRRSRGAGRRGSVRAAGRRRAGPHRRPGRSAARRSR